MRWRSLHEILQQACRQSGVEIPGLFYAPTLDGRIPLKPDSAIDPALHPILKWAADRGWPPVFWGRVPLVAAGEDRWSPYH